MQDRGVPHHLDRILVIRLDNIGDIVMLGPSLRALRKEYPEARITLMCSTAGSQVAPMLPWIDDILVWRAVWQEITSGHQTDAWKETQLVDLLRLGSYNAAFIFTSFSQSPYPPAYSAYLAGIPIRIGQSKEFGGNLLTHWYKPLPDHTHQVDRNLSILEELGIPVEGKHMELAIPDQVQKSADRMLTAKGIGPDDPFIVIAPGASCAARRYDTYRYAETIRLLSESRQEKIVLAGSPREKESLLPILQTSQRNEKIVTLVGETSVGEMASIIRRSNLVIANNSAALHIADVFHRPMVILYSGTEYLEQWRPRFSPVILLNNPVECSPCYRFVCPFQMECLDIPPDAIVAAVTDLLDDQAAKLSLHPITVSEQVE